MERWEGGAGGQGKKCRAGRQSPLKSWSESVRVTVHPSACLSLMSIHLSIIPSSLQPGDMSHIHIASSPKSPSFNSFLCSLQWEDRMRGSVGQATTGYEDWLFKGVHSVSVFLQPTSYSLALSSSPVQGDDQSISPLSLCALPLNMEKRGEGGRDERREVERCRQGGEHLK